MEKKNYPKVSCRVCVLFDQIADYENIYTIFINLIFLQNDKGLFFQLSYDKNKMAANKSYIS